MAISEDMQITRLAAADIDAALRLSDEAGWNQTGDDWRLFIEEGVTLGVFDDDGELVASAAAMPYEGRIGYVAMVLVTRSWRRRGLATRLVDACIAELERSGLVPTLDATPAGQAVYSKQGFHPLFELDRWQGAARSRGGSVGAGRRADASDLDRIVGLDAEAFGSRRHALLENFLARERTRALVDTGGKGFAMIRDGRRARQFGPVVAATQDEAIALIASLLEGESETVFIDVPSRWTAIAGWLKECGFSIQRSYARMARGTRVPFGSPERLFALAGPEFG